jgi:hypothetical protein
MSNEIANLQGLGIDALRQVAKGKIKSYAKFNKAGLLQALTDYFTAQAPAAPVAPELTPEDVARGEAALAVIAKMQEATPEATEAAPANRKTRRTEAKAAKKDKKAATCAICLRRPPMTSAMLHREGLSSSFNDMCFPCYIAAGWENTHSDNAHEEIAAYEASDKGKGTRAPLIKPADMQAEIQIMANCWICHPELDESRADYTQRAGTSRAGMQLATPVRLSGEGKAAIIAEKVTAATAATAEVKVSKHYVKLTIVLPQEINNITITLVWDHAGHTLYDMFAVTVAGKARKIRNVSDALRLVGAK